MNWEKVFNKHIEKTIKNINKFDIQENNKIFLKTSFLLADTTLRMFIFSVEEGSSNVVNKESGWTKRLKKITLEEYQELLKILLYTYFTHLDPEKNYSTLFDKQTINVGLDLPLYNDILNLPREVLGLLKIEKNLDNDFVNSTLNYMVAGYIERLDNALVRQLETLNEENRDITT